MASQAVNGDTSGELLVQPKFAGQIQSVPSPLGVNVTLQRGFMIWAEAGFLGYSGGELGDGRDIVNFMFNPSTISTDYQVANASLQSAMMFPNPGDSSQTLAPLMQSVSFDVFYDRTYELYYGGNSQYSLDGAANDPSVLGCQADVLQFMQFTGSRARLTQSQLGTISGASTSGSTQTGGMMMLVPAYLMFSNAGQQTTDNTSLNFQAIDNQMQFYGYISEWSVQYTHFTAKMIPIRCAISVTFTMLPDQQQAQQQAIWTDNSSIRNNGQLNPYMVPWPGTGTSNG
jgi:hypothetical protein